MSREKENRRRLLGKSTRRWVQRLKNVQGKEILRPLHRTKGVPIEIILMNEEEKWRPMKSTDLYVLCQKATFGTDKNIAFHEWLEEEDPK